ncbi:MAG: hypothetical protein K0B15_05975 [Lentimicrobium sp.]|nr:hypothetical protein [Lentimicrobium sp.]
MERWSNGVLDRCLGNPAFTSGFQVIDGWNVDTFPSSFFLTSGILECRTIGTTTFTT